MCLLQSIRETGSPDGPDGKRALVGTGNRPQAVLRPALEKSVAKLPRAAGIRRRVLA